MRVKTQINALPVTSDKFTPIGSQMLIKYEEKRTTDGGIIYPKPEQTWWADVISVGPQCEVEAGNRVLMEAYRGDNVDLEDGEFTIVNERDALLCQS